MFSYELTCRNCGWRTVSGTVDAAARLRILGSLRDEPDPDEHTLAAMLVDSTPRMTCRICKEKQLFATPSAAAADFDDGDWQQAVLCEVCREPIASERLDAIPNAKRCAACQGKAEAGVLVDDEPEYCEHCGAIVELRVTRGSGITRYKRFCTGEPPCRL
jgi:hypothetical protein